MHRWVWDRCCVINKQVVVRETGSVWLTWRWKWGVQVRRTGGVSRRGVRLTKRGVRVRWWEVGW